MSAPAMAKSAQSVEIDAIERLEEKVRKLVALVEEMRGERARLAAENRSLTDELGALRKKVVDGEGAAAEVAALREERDVVRTRVKDMLAQIEALEL
jgi:regulator of replication initiation timing